MISKLIDLYKKDKSAYESIISKLSDLGIKENFIEIVDDLPDIISSQLKELDKDSLLKIVLDFFKKNLDDLDNDILSQIAIEKLVDQIKLTPKVVKLLLKDDHIKLLKEKLKDIKDLQIYKAIAEYCENEFKSKDKDLLIELLETTKDLSLVSIGLRNSIIDEAEAKKLIKKARLISRAIDFISIMSFLDYDDYKNWIINVKKDSLNSQQSLDQTYEAKDIKEEFIITIYQDRKKKSIINIKADLSEIKELKKFIQENKIEISLNIASYLKNEPKLIKLARTAEEEFNIYLMTMNFERLKNDQIREIIITEEIKFSIEKNGKFEKALKREIQNRLSLDFLVETNYLAWNTPFFEFFWPKVTEFLNLKGLKKLILEPKNHLAQLSLFFSRETEFETCQKAYEASNNYLSFIFSDIVNLYEKIQKFSLKPDEEIFLWTLALAKLDEKGLELLPFLRKRFKSIKFNKYVDFYNQILKLKDKYFLYKMFSSNILKNLANILYYLQNKGIIETNKTFLIYYLLEKDQLVKILNDKKISAEEKEKLLLNIKVIKKLFRSFYDVIIEANEFVCSRELIDILANNEKEKNELKMIMLNRIKKLNISKTKKRLL